MLDLLTNPRDLYGIASDTARRLLNQTFCHRLYLDADEYDSTPRVSSDDPTEPIAPLLHVTRAGKRKSGGVINDTAATSTSALLATTLDEPCSSNRLWVEPSGFEPLTFFL
ncbi:hypothetical protein [Nonomuraea dietziae]|uniref:hypothetical protein n=1 Tax=Nonomuraea dietziae TaxID=65515 RepID=UPI0033F2CEC7